jgi:hypothetical protein
MHIHPLLLGQVAATRRHDLARDARATRLRRLHRPAHTR